jgi:octaprenyl-diphosphate synthase
MPLIYALARAEAKEAKAVLKIIKSKPGKAEVARVVEFVRNNGGIEYAARRSEEYVAAAVNALSVLPDTAARRSLEAFARFTTQRTS